MLRDGVRKNFPELTTEEEIDEATENLKRFLDLAVRIAKRRMEEDPNYRGPRPSVREPGRLTDEEWDSVSPLIETKESQSRRGRPRETSRAILEGVLWYEAQDGATWRDLAREFPPYQTCQRYHRLWTEDRTLRQVERVLKRVRGEL